MGSAKIFDFNAVMDRLEGDRELFRELVQIFFSEYDTTLQALRKACQSSDAKGVEEGAHALKSALGNLGAMAAFQTAFNLESAGRENKLERVGDMLARFETEVQQFKEEVQTSGV